MPVRRTRRLNPADAYAWVVDVRAYTDRIMQGPVTNADLAGQAHINEAAAQVEKALFELSRAISAHRLAVVLGDVSLPLLAYTALITVPRSQWAEVSPVKPIKRRKVGSNPVRRLRSR